MSSQNTARKVFSRLSKRLGMSTSPLSAPDDGEVDETSSNIAKNKNDEPVNINDSDKSKDNSKINDSTTSQSAPPRKQGSSGLQQEELGAQALLELGATSEDQSKSKKKSKKSKKKKSPKLTEPNPELTSATNKDVEGNSPQREEHHDDGVADIPEDHFSEHEAGQQVESKPSSPSLERNNRRNEFSYDATGLPEFDATTAALMQATSPSDDKQVHRQQSTQAPTNTSPRKRRHFETDIFENPPSWNYIENIAELANAQNTETGSLDFSRLTATGSFPDTDSHQLGPAPENPTATIRQSRKRQRQRRNQTAPSSSVNVVDPQLANIGISTEPPQQQQTQTSDPDIQPHQDRQLSQDDRISHNLSAAAESQDTQGLDLNSQHSSQQQQQRQGSTAMLGINPQDQNGFWLDVNAAAASVTGHRPPETGGGSFTVEENNILNDFMARYQEDNGMTYNDVCRRVWTEERRKDKFWDAVASLLPNRTRGSVYKHVRRKYHLYEQRGKWTPEEDLELGRLTQEKGRQWKIIGQIMARMPEDCRDRWRNYVKCGNARAQSKWQPEEVEKLRQVVISLLEEGGGGGGDSQEVNWTVVSEKMGGVRSRIQCRYKWNKLRKKDLKPSRADSMPLSEKIWMIDQLSHGHYEDEGGIPWEQLALSSPTRAYGAMDYKEIFRRLKPKSRVAKKFTNINDTIQNIQIELHALPESRRSFIPQSTHKSLEDTSGQSSAPPQESPPNSEQQADSSQPVFPIGMHHDFGL